jgi:hypothetical protein
LVAVFAMVGNPFRFGLSLGVRRANWFACSSGSPAG